MKLILTMVGTLLTLNTAFAAFNSPFMFDEMREEVKDMTLLRHAPNHSYKSARKFIMQKMHIEKDTNGYYVRDVYCKIKFRDGVAPNKMPDHRDINVEHTWPKSRFGVKKGTRPWKIRAADLHHLYPTDSETNSKRGNFFFTQFKDNENTLEKCPHSKRGYVSAIGESGFEPPAEHKGNVARALFYFAVRYDLRISEHEEFILRQWNIMDPVDEEEIRRNDFIENIQGNRNPFIDDPDLSTLISNF